MIGTPESKAQKRQKVHAFTAYKQETIQNCPVTVAKGFLGPMYVKRARMIGTFFVPSCLSFWIFCGISLATPQAQSPQTPTALKSTAIPSGTPIEIDAVQGIECDKDHKKCKLFEATVRQGSLLLKGSLLNVSFETAQGLKHVEGVGNIFIQSGKEYEVKAHQGSFDMPSGKAVLEKSVEAYDLIKNRHIRGDKAVFYFSQKENTQGEKSSKKSLELQKAEVHGNVYIKTPQENAQCDEAFYEAQKDFVTLTGHVHIRNKDGQISGDRAEMNLKTGINKMHASKGPVKVLLTSDNGSKKSSSQTQKESLNSVK